MTDDDRRTLRGGLHTLQTHLFYDGLAVDVPEVTALGSVALMLSPQASDVDAKLSPTINSRTRLLRATDIRPVIANTPLSELSQHNKATSELI